MWRLEGAHVHGVVFSERVQTVMADWRQFVSLFYYTVYFTVVYVVAVVPFYINTLYSLAATLVGKKEIFIIIVINRKDLETKLYMHNTIGDVALTNVTWEAKYLHVVQQACSYL